MASCGKLPRPFEPGVNDRANPLLRLSDSRGVVVAPIYDAPPELAAPLADAVAEGLRLHDIPATAADTLNAGNLLEGWYRTVASHAGRVLVIVFWRLSDPDGTELFALESRKLVLVKTLARKPELGLNEFSNDIVLAVARAMIGDHPNGRAGRGLTVKLGQISGAPGDGSAALKRAVRAVLRRADISVAAQTEDAIAHLEAQIEVKAQSRNQDQVRLVWTIRDSKQKVIAVLKQQNVVSKGRLDRRWGPVAFDIVFAIRPQIVEAVRRLGEPKPLGLAVPPTLQ